MKHIVLFVSMVALLTTAGCIVAVPRGGGDFHGRGEFRGHGEYRERPEYRPAPQPGVDVRVRGF